LNLDTLPQSLELRVSDSLRFQAIADLSKQGFARGRQRLRKDRIMSTVNFLFLLSTLDTRFRPPRMSAGSDPMA
jgi:hypothetical protein